MRSVEQLLQGISIAVPAGQKLYGVMPGDTVRVSASIDYRGPALDDNFYAAIGSRVVIFDEYWDSGPVPIHFDASESYDPDGTIVNYSWDFGDGNTAIGVTANHAYSEDGNYTVTLTVTDDDGASASLVATKIVETEETALPLAVLSVIGLGVTSLTATLLYGLFIRRKKKKKKTEENT